MLTLTSEAIAFAQENGGVFYLDYVQLTGCCIPYQPEPTVRLGAPPNGGAGYREEDLQGIRVFIPHDLPDVPLTVAVSTVLTFKRLVVDGWIHA